METITRNLANLKNWRFIATAPLSGEENMHFDAETLRRVSHGQIPATVRFFRFESPTVTYGRLQRLENIQAFIPDGWSTAQRPTGGGIVHHKEDLCISLAWARHERPMPSSPKEVYRFIHSLILQGLGNGLHLAACGDICAGNEPFEFRHCFTQPVGDDILSGSQKVVGGALRCTKEAILYQGSLQIPNNSDIQRQLKLTFEKNFLYSQL